MKIFTKLIFLIALFFSAMSSLESRQDVQPFAKIVATSPQQRALGAAKHALIFRNFPINQGFMISFARGLQPDSLSFKEVEKIQIDEKGTVFVEREARGKNYGLNFEGIARGERVRYRFNQTDGTLLSEISYVPKPIRKKSRGKTFSIKAELLGIFPITYLFKFKGIKEGEILKIRSTCGQKMTQDTVEYRESQLPKIVLEMEGRRGETSLIEILREDGDKLALRLKGGNSFSAGAKH
ncbi:hypothetical protein [Parachlamydia sp. AcF125]|uniref:hypothetical protein n=1 Tax=Parachlamydia sp. AcF125 TaxID=2795736 RepID=UPI001BC91C6B|nr:hypothetical protein [Parachlamydia sp. AcF125]MBS4168346.1 hypothetical protein [Parachlamydia sp. AcF125]